MNESPISSEAEQRLDANTLLELFYHDPAGVCSITRVPAEAVPPPFDQLLVHENHMTVTVESFHNSLVNVQVLDETKSDDIYARKILLTRKSDGQIVQFGIVRIHRHLLPEATREAIERGEIPLGRILIEQGVLRKVELCDLWKCQTNGELQQLMQLDQPTTLFGRTAIIYVDQQPVIELLEIVTPGQTD